MPEPGAGHVHLRFEHFHHLRHALSSTPCAARPPCADVTPGLQHPCRRAPPTRPIKLRCRRRTA
jgi:hypothetical protein